MTTGVIKDGVGAIDTQLSQNGRIYRVQKIYRLPDGGFALGEGEWWRCYAFIQWLIDGEEGERPSLLDATIYVCRPDTSIWVAEGTGGLYPILDRVLAFGCGADLARAALDAGGTPLEALEAASASDIYTSAPFQTMAVCTPAELPGAVTHAPKRKRA